MNASLDIIGGTYGEECSFPRVTMFRGSGGRAASFFSSINIDVTLYTYLGPQLSKQFRRQACTFKFKIKSIDSPYDVWFRYRHPLACPDIYYLPRQAKLPSFYKINSNYALVFGMLEERPVVKAKKVVYDPQDGSKAKTFESNGSFADEMAIVVSYSEGVALTGKKNPNVIVQKLLSKNVVVVIVKCGPQGALVATKTMSSWIRSFPTSRVYKIGSGDIFSSAFAYYWLLKNTDPFLSAWFASRITAAYVESCNDRFDNNNLDKFESEAKQVMEKFDGKAVRDIPNTQIYLAGPFFNTSQQWLIEETRILLQDMGFKVFSPIHDVGVGSISEVAAADLNALDKSGLVLAIMDGLDSGTIFEIGYARAKNIPVIVIAESVYERDLTMILGSGCEVTNDFSTGIYASCWHLMNDV